MHPKSQMLLEVHIFMAKNRINEKGVTPFTEVTPHF